MKVTEQQLQKIIIQETKKEILLKEAIRVNPRLLKIGKAIYKAKSVFKVANASSLPLGIRRSFLVSIESSYRHLDDTLEAITKVRKRHYAGFGKLDDLDFTAFKRDLTNDLKRVEGVLDSELTHLKHELDVYNMAGSTLQARKLEMQILHLDDTQRNIKKALVEASKDTFTRRNLFNMSYAMKYNDVAPLARRVGPGAGASKTPKSPKTAEPSGTTGGPVGGKPRSGGPVGGKPSGVTGGTKPWGKPFGHAGEGAIRRAFRFPDRLVVWGLIGAIKWTLIGTAFHYVAAPVLRAISKALGAPQWWIDFLADALPAVAAYLMEVIFYVASKLHELDGPGAKAYLAANHKGKITAEVRALILLKFIETSPGTTISLKKKGYDANLREFGKRLVWADSDDKKARMEGWLKEACVVKRNEGRLNTMAEKGELDGLFHAVFAAYIGKKLGGKVVPSKLTGQFELLSNCISANNFLKQKASRGVPGSLKKLVKKHPNDGHFKNIERYCRSGKTGSYTISSAAKVRLINWAFPNIDKVMKSAAQQVEQDTLALLDKVETRTGADAVWDKVITSKESPEWEKKANDALFGKQD